MGNSDYAPTTTEFSSEKTNTLENLELSVDASRYNATGDIEIGLLGLPKDISLSNSAQQTPEDCPLAHFQASILDGKLNIKFRIRK